MGDKIFFPNSQQFDLMNENLAKIAKAVGSQVDITTWAGIQKAVRAGIAPDILPVGTQLLVKHSVYGEHLYDVVAHDYLKSVHDENAHTMTLLCHDQIAAIQFDSMEAFYYAEAELPAGTYNFTLATAYSSWAAGTYQFTLTQALPKGGQLAISGYADAAMTARQVKAFASRTATAATESVAITSGNGGTSLGTFGVELNHSHRVSYGSNNYKESAIRQFLNSPSAAGSVWTPQTKFDRPPTWMTSLAGFVGGLDDDFLSVVGEVIVPCSANNTYEAPDSTVAKGAKYTVTDKFYLASQREIFGNNSDSVADDSVLFPYYEGADAADRIKYRDGSAAYWWVRTPLSWDASVVRSVLSTGPLDYTGAIRGTGCSPACTIV